MKYSLVLRSFANLALAMVCCSAPGNAQTVTATPVTLTFSFLSGSALPAAQAVAVKISAGTPTYTVAITGTNTLWLTAVAGSTKLPGNISVRVNPTTLAVGQYLATIVVTVTGVASPVNIPVTLNVSAPAPTLTLSGTTLSFTSPPIPVSTQSIKLATNTAPLSYTATVAAAPWLTVSPASGVLLPGSQLPLVVTVDPTSLSPQTAPYTGKITVAAPAALGASKSQVITVSLIVNSQTPTATTVWPAALPLNAPNTTITIQGTNFYSATVAKITGVTAPLATTVLGTNVLLAVIPAAQLTSASTLNVIVTNPAPGGDSTALPVTVGAGATIQAVVSAASLQSGPVSPGELITLFGADIGPTVPAVLADADTDGFVDTSLGTVTATVDGQSAPLIYVSQNQISLQVPYGATVGANKVISVTTGANAAVTTSVTIAATAPALFSLNGSGMGPAAALNFNSTTSAYTVNATANAAKAGDTVVLYMTGEGDYATTITPRTGLIFPSTISPMPQLSPLPTVTIGGTAATVSYAGPSVGSMLGILQLNVVVPAGITASPAVPVMVTIAGNPSPAGITLALK